MMEKLFQRIENLVELSIHNIDDFETLSTIVDCLQGFKSIVDSCDDTDPLKTPHD